LEWFFLTSPSPSVTAASSSSPISSPTLNLNDVVLALDFSLPSSDPLMQTFLSSYVSKNWSLRELCQLHDFVAHRPTVDDDDLYNHVSLSYRSLLPPHLAAHYNVPLPADHPDFNPRFERLLFPRLAEHLNYLLEEDSD